MLSTSLFFSLLSLIFNTYHWPSISFQQMNLWLLNLCHWSKRAFFSHSELLNLKILNINPDSVFHSTVLPKVNSLIWFSSQHLSFSISLQFQPVWGESFLIPIIFSNPPPIQSDFFFTSSILFQFWTTPNLLISNYKTAFAKDFVGLARPWVFVMNGRKKFLLSKGSHFRAHLLANLYSN